MDHKGRYTRGYLPHCDFHDSIQAITFRLADSVPKQVLEAWRNEALRVAGDKRAEADIRRRIAAYEDAGHGSGILRRVEIGIQVQQQLLAGNGVHYRLIEWCIMPNHVHALISMGDRPLGSIVQTWKGGSAAAINRQLGRRGALWMPDYHDRFIRDVDHFHDARTYIRRNPVKAGLCQEPELWPLSSAGESWDPAAKEE